MIKLKLSDTHKMEIQGGVDSLAVIAAMLIILGSLIIALRVTYGIWDTDKSSMRLKRLYQIPFINVATWYLRRRNGIPFGIAQPRRRFPWEA